MGKQHKHPKPTKEDAALAEALELDTQEVATITEGQEDAEQETNQDQSAEETLGSADADTITDGDDNEAAGDVVEASPVGQLFRRMEPKYKPEESTRKARTPASYKTPEKQRDEGISSNSATLTYPTDRWGLTKDVKTAITAMASRIAGDATKKELADEVLTILIKHMNIKFKADAERRAAIAARTDEDGE